VPVYTSALLMCAQPGAELACRGHNYNLPLGAQAQPRGVLSYYATATLPKASSLGDWLLRIESMARQDVDAGNLPPFYRPELEIVGDPDTPLPGIPQ
jgi:hypothetical protein